VTIVRYQQNEKIQNTINRQENVEAATAAAIVQRDLIPTISQYQTV